VKCAQAFPRRAISVSRFCLEKRRREVDCPVIKSNLNMKKNLFRRIALFGAVAVVVSVAALLPAGPGPAPVPDAKSPVATNGPAPTNAHAATNTPASGPLAHTLAATNADAAWAELRDAIRTPPPFPDAWSLQEPSPAEQIRFLTPYIVAIADKSKDFYTRFPNDTNEVDAKINEMGALSFLVEKASATNQQARLDAARNAVFADTNLSEDDRFDLRNDVMQRAMDAKMPEGDAAVLAEFEKGARSMQKEFPNRPEVMDMLMSLAQVSEPEKSRELLKDVAANTNAPDEIKDAAVAMSNQLNRVGKPLSLKYSAVDGREVDLEKMRGKVVLVDFWATDSGRSMEIMSDVKDAYTKFHSKGFEIAGINVDDDKASLTNYVAEEKVEWPQYFDGKSMKTKFAVEFGLDEKDLPAMWLVDKKGVLRYINAEFDFDKKIERLLGE
jgi:thiol-disulfide isomerase/thioredoxin